MKLIALFLSFKLHSFMQINQETYKKTIIKTKNPGSKMVSHSHLRKTLDLFNNLLENLDIDENG